MRLIQWTPTAPVRSPNGWQDIDREFDRLMNWALGGTVPDTRATMPAMDWVEEKDHYRVTFDLPGLSKEDLELTYQEGVLTVKGARKHESEESKEGRVVRQERFRGTFERTVRLPEKVDANRIEAKFQNGVLELTLPFLPEAKPHRLQIQG
jgi:HSP20 family protein